MSLDDTPFQKQLSCQKNEQTDQLLNQQLTRGSKPVERSHARCCDFYSPWKTWREEPTRNEIPETPQSVTSVSAGLRWRTRES